MTFYLIFYVTIVLLLLLDLCARNIPLPSVRQRSPFFAIAVFVTVFVSGFRYNTGYDFLHYVQFYREHPPAGMEPLFAYSVTFFNYFTDDPQLMFFTYSLATVSILLLAIKRFTKYTKTSFLIFLLVPGFFINSFSIIRQSLAMVILFYGMSFLILDDRKGKFLIISSVSAMLHYSAVFPALLFLLGGTFLRKEYRLNTLIGLALLSLVLCYFDVARFMGCFSIGRYSQYIDSKQAISPIKILILNLFVFFLLLNRRQFVENSSDTFLLNSMFIGVLITNFFSDFLPLVRFSYYFLIAEITLIPKLIYAFKDNNMRCVYLLAFMCCHAALMINAMLVDLNFDYYPKMIPYVNYFFK